jgi:hypothetical protein
LRRKVARLRTALCSLNVPSIEHQSARANGPYDLVQRRVKVQCARNPDSLIGFAEEGHKRWNQLDGDKELGGAWWLLFKQVQNPRHFLSELVQNADDSGATEACAGVESPGSSIRGQPRRPRPCPSN